MNAIDDDLSRTLRAHFRAQIDSAPPLPARLRSAAEGDRAVERRSRMRGVAVAAAVLAMIAVTMALVPGTRAVASAREAVAAAAARLAGEDDATLEIVLTSPTVDLLSNLFADEPREYGAPLGDRQYLRIKRPNRFLLFAGVRDVAALSAARPVAGFDGERAWSYDAEKNVVSLDSIKIESNSDGGQSSVNFDESFDLMKMLSFDFVRELASSSTGKDALVIEETTSSFEKRANRRAFKIARPKDPGKDDSPLWTESTVTIDADSDRIERFTLAVSLGPIDLFRVRAELVSTDDGFDDAEFEWRTHAPDATLAPPTQDSGENR